MPQVFRAETTIQILRDEDGEMNPRRTTAVQASASGHLARDIVEMQSREVLSDVVRKANLSERWRLSGPEAAARLRRQLEIRRSHTGHSLILAVQESSREDAAELANVIAERFVSRKTSDAVVRANRRASRLAKEVDEQRDRVIELEKTLLELNLGPEAGTETVDEKRRELLVAGNVLRALEAQHQAATIEAHGHQNVAAISRPADPGTTTLLGNNVVTTSLLVFAGIGFGIVTVVFTGLRRGRFEVLHRLGERLDVGLVTLVPVTGRSFLQRGRPGPALIEPFRDLRNKIDRLPAGDCLFLTLVPGGTVENFAEVPVNLAAVHADAGHTVLVIDANMRDPQLHPCFEAGHHPGLSDYLSGEMRLEETIIKARRDNLWFMPSGPLPIDPSGLIAGRRMTDLVWNMRSRFDCIIVVSPSVLDFAEGGPLAEVADHTIAVSSYRTHSVSRLRKIRELVELASGVFSGVVLTEDRPCDEPIEPVVQIRPAGRDTGEIEAGNAVSLDACRSTLASRIRRSRQADR